MVSLKRENEPNSVTDPKNSVREKEPHLTLVVCLEESAGIPGDGKDRTGAALGESKSVLDMRRFCVLGTLKGSHLVSC